MKEKKEINIQDIQKKHESDLTRQEKWLLEKDKLSGMNRNEKLEYIWTYYKPVIFGFIGFIFAIWAGFSWYENAKYDTVMYAVPINSVMEAPEAEAMENDFKEFIGDTDQYHRITIDTSISQHFMGNEAVDRLSMESEVKMSTIVAANEVDIIIGTAEQLEQFIAQGIAMDMNEILSKEMLEKHGDKIVDDVKFDVSSSKKVMEGMKVNADPAYLIILSNGKHHEMAAQFVEYLME